MDEPIEPFDDLAAISGWAICENCSPLPGDALIGSAEDATFSCGTVHRDGVACSTLRRQLAAGQQALQAKQTHGGLMSRVVAAHTAEIMSAKLVVLTRDRRVATRPCPVCTAPPKVPSNRNLSRYPAVHSPSNVGPSSTHHPPAAQTSSPACPPYAVRHPLPATHDVRPGILLEVSFVVTEHTVNIIDVHSETQSVGLASAFQYNVHLSSMWQLEELERVVRKLPDVVEVVRGSMRDMMYDNLTGFWAMAMSEDER